MKYLIECVKLHNHKLYQGWDTIECRKPHEAMDKFIEKYLAPLDYCDRKKGGVIAEENRYISCKVGYKNEPYTTHYLTVRYKEVKKKHAQQTPKKLLDEAIKDSTAGVESTQPSKT